MRFLSLCIALFLCSLPCFSQESSVAPIRKLIREGKLVEALKQTEAAEQSFEIRHLAGYLQILHGQPDKAGKILEAALADADKANPEGTEISARLLNDLGVVSYQNGAFPEAKAHFRRALELRQKLLAAHHADTIQSLRNLALTEAMLGEAKVSSVRLRESIDLLKTLLADPKMAPASSAEAVPVRIRRPIFPRILITFETRAVPVFVTVNPPMTADIAAVAEALDRLRLTLDLASPIDYIAIRGPQEILTAEKAFGMTDFRTQITRANYDDSQKPEMLPLPFNASHPLTISMNLNQISRKVRDLQTTKEFLPATTEIRKSILAMPGNNGLLNTRILDLLGVMAHHFADHERSRTFFRDSLALKKLYLPATEPGFAETLAAVGVESYYLGDYRTARITLESAWQKFRSPGILNDLAILYRQQGDFASARRMLEEALGAMIKADPKDYNVRITKNNLAVIQLEMGDLAPAAAHFRKVIEDETSDFLKDEARISLAGLLRISGQPAEAAALYETLLKKAPQNLFLLNSLGATYRDLRQFDKAEPLLKSALDARLKLPNGARHPDTAFTYSSLGLLHLQQGKTAEAVADFDAALKIYQTQTGQRSISTGDLLKLRGLTHMIAGKPEEAKKDLADASDLKLHWVDEVLPSLSESDALAFTAGLSETDLLLNVLRNDPKSTPEQLYEVVWRNRGLATKALVARRQFPTENPRVQTLSRNLKATNDWLAYTLFQRGKLAYLTPLPSEKELNPDAKNVTTSELVEKWIGESQQRREKLEADLAAASDSYRHSVTRWKLTPTDLAKELPADSAVVDFLRTRRWAKKADGTCELTPTLVYEAFVLRSLSGKASISRFDLGSAETIEDAINSWRTRFAGVALKRSGKAIDAKLSAVENPETVLRKAIWEPLTPALKDASKVILIPDGELTRLPFAALPGKAPETYLLEEFSISTVAWGQQIPELLRQKAPTGTTTLMLGGVDFDGPATTEPKPSGTAIWMNLPGTREEVEVLAARSPLPVTRLGGKDATRTTLLKELSGSRYVHLATHGFFSDPDPVSVLHQRPDPIRLLNEVSTVSEPKIEKIKQPAGNVLELRSNPVFRSLTGQNPMALSGLVLSGANSGNPASILTAETISDLDLRETELVVLSACETGLGTVAGGEGVLGIQRALSLAGARSTVTTLWQIPDEATRILMERFYRNLWEGKMSKTEALREAQLWMLRSGEANPGVKRGMVIHSDLPKPKADKRMPPFFWAAFVLSGDWR